MTLSSSSCFQRFRLITQQCPPHSAAKIWNPASSSFLKWHPLDLLCCFPGETTWESWQDRCRYFYANMVFQPKSTPSPQPSRLGKWDGFGLWPGLGLHEQSLFSSWLSIAGITSSPHWRATALHLAAPVFPGFIPWERHRDHSLSHGSINSQTEGRVIDNLFFWQFYSVYSRVRYSFPQQFHHLQGWCHPFRLSLTPACHIVWPWATAELGMVGLIFNIPNLFWRNGAFVRLK